MLCLVQSYSVVTTKKAYDCAHVRIPLVEGCRRSQILEVAWEVASAPLPHELQIVHTLYSHMSERISQGIHSGDGLFRDAADSGPRYPPSIQSSWFPDSVLSK